MHLFGKWLARVTLFGRVADGGFLLEKFLAESWEQREQRNPKQKSNSLMVASLYLHFKIVFNKFFVFNFLKTKIMYHRLENLNNCARWGGTLTFMLEKRCRRESRSGAHSGAQGGTHSGEHSGNPNLNKMAAALDKMPDLFSRKIRSYRTS